MADIKRFVTGRSGCKLFMWPRIGQIITACKADVCLDVTTCFLRTYRECQADCADYEVYRSGKYVPGLMGTLFSFVDKLISSLSTTIVGLCCAAIGFKDALPTVDTPMSPAIKAVAMFCMYGLLIIGLVCNLIAMKFYPLTKEKMESIQAEIAEIKKKAESASV